MRYPINSGYIDEPHYNICVCGYKNKRFMGKYCTMSCYYKHEGRL